MVERGQFERWGWRWMGLNEKYCRTGMQESRECNNLML